MAVRAQRRCDEGVAGGSAFLFLGFLVLFLGRRRQGEPTETMARRANGDNGEESQQRPRLGEVEKERKNENLRSGEERNVKLQ
ncbi:hypothetical protein VIGAN_01132100 [Vigna angularis var. angularis]|uniref:Uncharacterized protein n=1 Tax=Vigna angularis var. angularis TaxID=157739 RepID=A0A0S3QZL2_PHAAN|nr:hypothetical protein VIGAN_01132100 [Vigna angularis var. angularis]